MKQILQSLKTGETEIADIPAPRVKPGHLLIETTKSLISAGTERMLVDFGKASLLNKVRQQPDKVRQVFDKIKTDGLFGTLDAVRAKLDQKIPMGYCNVGVVHAIHEDCDGFAIGDRVVSNGSHAEFVTVPKNLCCKIPDNVSDDDAAFTVLGAIALQGIRLANPSLGETFVVIGLGLIGLLAVQLLRANGCRVLAIDIDAKKIEHATSLGATAIHATNTDCVQFANRFSRGRGVDGVIITAATDSNEPMHQAASMCRKKGRIILTGVTGLALSRADFYEKELSFAVSCSYGPGRYDSQYEEAGQDYPVGFVRFTAQRNFEAFLDMLQQEKIDLTSLISHRFLIQQATEAYALLGNHEAALGILIDYTKTAEQKIPQRIIELQPVREQIKKIKVGVIGAGNYANRILMPAFKKANVTLMSIACSGGVSGVHVGKKFGFAQATTDSETILNHQEINTVVIATRHDSHAALVNASLCAGKHVFVEKPLCLTLAELKQIEETHRLHPNLCLMIGFNRRFAPLSLKIKTLLESIATPKSFIMTVNALEIPSDHWTQLMHIGGGRIIGEACHFVDLLRYLAQAPIVSYQLTHMNNVAVRSDKISISLTFADGSFGVIHYLANGHRSFPKERLEVFAEGRILQLDNFRKLRGYGWGGFKQKTLWAQDKGQQACVNAFIEAIQTGSASPIPFDEIVEVSKTTIELATMCQSA